MIGPNAGMKNTSDSKKLNKEKNTNGIDYLSCVWWAMKKWVIGCLIIGPIMIAIANYYDLQWLKIISGTILIVTGLTVYVTAIKNDWQWGDWNVWANKRIWSSSLDAAFVLISHILLCVGEFIKLFNVYLCDSSRWDSWWRTTQVYCLSRLPATELSSRRCLHEVLC